MVRITQENGLISFDEISIELTHQCTMNCIYCSSEGKMNKTISLEIKRLIEIINEVHNEFKVDTISLSGGETFLYRRFNELIDFINQLDMNIIIYTSGVITNGDGKYVSIDDIIIKPLKERKYKITILFNVQGYNQESIEIINRSKGSYKLICGSINNCVNAGLNVGANIVPFSYNYNNLEEILDFCINKKMKSAHFLRFVPQGRGSEKGLYNTKAQFKRINITLHRLLLEKGDDIDIRFGHPINFLHLLGAEKDYAKEKYSYCRGGLDAPLILPNGDVAMCPAWKNLNEFIAGNIYNDDFKTIWTSKHFKQFRDFIREDYINIDDPCKKCKFLHLCRGKCVAQRLLDIKQGDGIESLSELITNAPDPQCFKED